MAVPDFQTMMSPLFEDHAGGAETPFAAVRQRLAEQFHLSEGNLALGTPLL
jgi:restriction endonuclease Mrr